MRSTFWFLRVRGIAIGAHWSWLFIALLVVWSLAAGLFPSTYPGLPGSAYLVMAIVATVIFFVSVLLHELGHALTAQREGIEIRQITLWLLGGVAHLRGRPASAGADFRVAIAGPVVTLLLGGLFYLVMAVGRAMGWPAAVVGVADYLGRINLLLLVFNMLPALPLDGGRVLRDWLWHRQRSYLRATQWSAGVGKAFGVVLAALGVLSLFTTTGFSGIWFLVLGWFLAQAAQAEADDAVTRQSLQGLTVRDMMRPDPVTVDPDISVDRFFDTAAKARFSAFPVTEEGRLRGLVTLSQAAMVPPDQREDRTVGDIMLGRDQVPVLPAQQDAAEALELFRDDGRRAVVVDAADRVLGVLSTSDVAHTLQVRLARGLPEDPGERRRGRFLAVAIVVLALLVGGAFFYQPPVVVVSPGPAFDVSRDVTVQGRDVTQVNGRYLATTVRLEQPNAVEAAIAGVRPDREVVSASSVLPAGTSPEDYVAQQRRLYEQSRQVAAAAAARAVGLRVNVSGSGVIVAGVIPGAPAAAALRQGDVIVAVDHRDLHHTWQLQETVAARPAGTRFTLTVERGGATRQVSATSAELPRLAQGVGIGVLGQTRDLRVDLPFQVRFAQREEVGGPSAGVAYALAIADLLARKDYARGRTIAATGTIALDGSVGPVGGVAEKAVSAKEAGADLFLVPGEDAQDTAEHDPGLPVHDVRDLEQALRVVSGSSS
ncbi:site-2 protease family protein [Nonomuraea sp. H19]|uniref:site-2 protease family protein n=1 Tax=Nonomuraea sp. H19 TaxID=3452206 RepID=UPI003F8B0627